MTKQQMQQLIQLMDAMIKQHAYRTRPVRPSYNLQQIHRERVETLRDKLLASCEDA